MALCEAKYGCKCQDAFNNTYSCLRSLSSGGEENTLYCEFDDDVQFVEMYDLANDPYQLSNLGQRMDEETRRRYSAKLAVLKACRGRDQCFQP